MTGCRKNNIFYPKILLFGEYSVILHSQALTIPYDYYQGELKIPKTDLTFQASATQSRKELKSFFQYLQKSKRFKQYQNVFDWAKFQFDLNRGLFFDSNIPQGYGLGSSGALSAAIFYSYMDKRFQSESSLNETRQCLSTMESYFHGTSSGLDPLVSFVNKPILYEKEHSHFVEMPKDHQKGKVVIFLLDTGRQRRTEALVNLFLEKLKNPLFSQLCHDELIAHTHKGIEAFLEQSSHSLFQAFYQVSRFQYDHFLPMIPKNYHDKWRQGLEGSQTLLKLCGAGGGGYLLGMTQDFNMLAQSWSEEQIKVLWRYTK